MAFSIEDKNAINTRQKRLEKSRAGLARRQANGSTQKEWEKQRREGRYPNNQVGGKNPGHKGKKNESTDRNNALEKANSSQDANSSKQLTRKDKIKLKFQTLQEKKRNRKTIEATPGNVEG